MAETPTWPARHAPSTAPAVVVPPLLSVRDLTIEFTSRHGTLVAVDRVSFDIRKGEIRAIIGEDFRFLTLNDFPSAPKVIEDADTFAGNATKKAVTLAQWLEADGVDPGRFPKVAAHRQRMSERAAVRKALAEELVPVVA